jgi:hypothetical protein
MRRAKEIAASVEQHEPIVEFTGDRPWREVEIIKPFNLQGDNGERLEWGNRYRVRAELADLLVVNGQAVDVATGLRLDKRRGGVNEPMVPPQQTSSKDRRSGKTIRVRVLPPSSIEIENGKILNPGEEYDCPIEQLSMMGLRVERVDKANDPRPERRVVPMGEAHPVRITAGGPGCAIWSVALDRQVEHEEAVILPESEASILIAMGRAVSLRPEVPSPAAIEMGELLAGGDAEKAGKIATLATRILKGQIH